MVDMLCLFVPIEHTIYKRTSGRREDDIIKSMDEQDEIIIQAGARKRASVADDIPAEENASVAEAIVEDVPPEDPTPSMDDKQQVSLPDDEISNDLNDVPAMPTMQKVIIVLAILAIAGFAAYYVLVLQ